MFFLFFVQVNSCWYPRAQGPDKELASKGSGVFARLSAAENTLHSGL